MWDRFLFMTETEQFALACVKNQKQDLFIVEDIYVLRVILN